MFSGKDVIIFTLFPCFISGLSIQNGISSNVTESGQKQTEREPLTTQCAPDKSHHSKNDIMVLIDHIYTKDAIDKVIRNSYQAQAVATRDRHIEDIKHFTAWFENQPEHLKHVLDRISKLRKEKVEPNVEKVATVLKEYPQLEQTYNEKNDKTEQLLNKLDKYNILCQFNCNDPKIKVHNITKRSTPSESFYCSSIKDLHDSIRNKLSEFVTEIKNKTNNELSVYDKKYEEKIEEKKRKLKDKALKKFGRTMYDILSLEDEYHHFMENLTSKDLEDTVYTIKSLGFQVDVKLLQLEQAIEKYGRYCKSCSSALLKRNTRRADIKSRVSNNETSINILDELLENKFHTVINEIDNDWKNIFKDLDVLMQKPDSKEFNLDNLKPVQKDIEKMTQDEVEILNKLNSVISQISIKKVLDLIKKIQDILKIIEDILSKLPKTY